MTEEIKPKILLFDIETSPNLAYSFGGKWEVNIVAFKKHFEILSFAYKWLDEKQVTFVSAEGAKDDRSLLVQLKKVLEDADIVIGHNLDAFDVKKFNTRLAYWKARTKSQAFSPSKILATVDTKKVAKRYFGFSSNSLDDLGEFLGLGRKVKHEGIELWLQCMANDSAAWKRMKMYNIQDVFLLEKVYQCLKPWIQNHPNVAKIKEQDSGCPNCGSPNVQKKGVRANSSGFRQQMKCTSCDSWYLTTYRKPREP